MTIKEFRQSQGLSQPKLAKALGVGASTIGGYETGRVNPSQKIFDKIKEVFGVDLTATEAAPVEEKPAEAKKPAKRAAKKKAAPVEEKVEAVEEPTLPSPTIIIQSAMGGEITVDEILAKVGDVEKVYVKPEENAAYWVKGEENGAVALW